MNMLGGGCEMDFHTYYDRKNSRSVKWDLLENVFQTNDVLPMWVGDMDFKAPNEVNEALINRVKHGVYGYTIIDHKVKASIINWIEHQHQWKINQSWLSFSLGVVPSLHSAIQAFTEPTDKILIQ